MKPITRATMRSAAWKRDAWPAVRCLDAAFLSLISVDTTRKVSKMASYERALSRPCFQHVPSDATFCHSDWWLRFALTTVPRRLVRRLRADEISNGGTDGQRGTIMTTSAGGGVAVAAVVDAAVAVDLIRIRNW